MSNLKCFVIHDGDEGWSIQFAKSHVHARRQGANEIGCEFEEVESCRRRKEWDSYAPGPVPASVTIEGGWWWECHHCGRMVGYDDADPEVIEWGNQQIFCGPMCAADEIHERRLSKITKQALEDWGRAEVVARFPEATDVIARSEAVGDTPWWVEISFSFPGGRYPAQWYWSKDHDPDRAYGRKNGVAITRADEDAWYRFRPAGGLN